MNRNANALVYRLVTRRMRAERKHAITATAPATDDSGTEVSDASQRAVCTSIVLTGINLGQFLSAFATSGLAHLFSDGSPASAFLVVGIASILIGFGIIVYETIRRKREL